jgi:hypothetical protein
MIGVSNVSTRLQSESTWSRQQKVPSAKPRETLPRGTASKKVAFRHRSYNPTSSEIPLCFHTGDRLFPRWYVQLYEFEPLPSLTCAQSYNNPTQIFAEDVTEEKGENARLSAFVGAIAVGDLVKSTLGPKGMDKILQSAYVWYPSMCLEHS